MRGIAVTSCLASSETAEMAASVAHHAKKPGSATGRHDSARAICDEADRYRSYISLVEVFV